MARDQTSDLCVATASGRRAGRFLVAALSDTLSGGGVLVEVVEPKALPPRATGGADFVFASVDSRTSEVLRAGTNARGEVVGAQLLRRPLPSQGKALPNTDELAKALRVAKSVGYLRWREQAPCTIEVVLLPQRFTVLLPAKATREDPIAGAAPCRSGDRDLVGRDGGP